MSSLLSSLLSLLLVMGATVWPNYYSAEVLPQVTNRSAAPKVIPFEFVNRHIVIPVTVNNSRPLSFVLDTGDQFAIINLDAAKALGLKLRGQVRVGGAGAQLQTGAFVDGATFTVPGLDGFSQRMTLALPIGHLTPRLGHDFDGIIGSEFIEQFVVEIDYPAHVLRLHNKTGFVYTGAGQAIPIKLVHGHPILEDDVYAARTGTNQRPFCFGHWCRPGSRAL